MFSFIISQAKRKSNRIKKNCAKYKGTRYDNHKHRKAIAVIPTITPMYCFADSLSLKRIRPTTVESKETPQLKT